MSQPNNPNLTSDQAARNYTLVCVTSLAVILLVGVLGEGLTCWTLVPVLVGGLGLVLRLSSAPLLLILALAGFELVLTPLRDFTFGRIRTGATPVADLIICAAVLAYAAGHYRLEGLSHQLFPRDPRRPGGRLPRTVVRANIPPEEARVRQTRSGRLVSGQEIVVLIATLPLWAGLAHAVWYGLPARSNFLGVPSTTWQLILLGWLFGLGVLVITAFLNYLGQQWMTRQEAALILQETLWQETRGEQRSINRWLAWARLRRRSRKEQS